MKKQGKQELENQGRIQAKYMHLTLHKIKNKDKAYWAEKARKFRSNMVAVLVGIEENHEEGKGVHAHIFIQFSTRQILSRKQFVDHFGTDSLHISTRKSKDDLLQGLGYVSKTGNIYQYGTFTYRGTEIDTDPEVYRFNYVVNSKLDAIRYFKKVIKESLGSHKNKNIIKEYAKRDDAIGDYLVANPSITNSLHKLAYTWYLDAVNQQKLRFKFREFVKNDNDLEMAYNEYLREFPAIFEKELPEDSPLVLEHDYTKHKANDLAVIKRLAIHLQVALRYGPERPPKSLNVYLWSRNPSFGKTRLLNFLDDHMMAYRLPDDQYYVDYENGIYQVLVSDEADSFIKSKEYSHLKHIFEGQRVEFNRKGREKVFKEDNPMIVLADNISFDELMKKRHGTLYTKEVMMTRVVDLELKSRATLHFFIDRCITIEDRSVQLPLLN